MDTKIQNVIEEVSRIFEVDLKEKQIEAMQTFMSGRDVFVTLPTGYGMYTRAATINKKEQVLTAFRNPNGTLRIVLATTAFGMGVDCSDIHVIIHWGAPSSLEQYVQETGRAGRDVNPQKQAILYYGKPGRYVGQDVKDYMQWKRTSVEEKC